MERPTHQDTIRAVTWNAAVADALRERIRDSADHVSLAEEPSDTTAEVAGTTGSGPFHRQTERNAADALDPEQAQTQAVERQITEESLFDETHLSETGVSVLEDIPENQKQTIGGSLSETSQMGLSSPRRAPNVKDRAQKVVTQLSFGQIAATNPTPTDTENQQQSGYGLEGSAPIGNLSTNTATNTATNTVASTATDTASNASPARKVTVTFRMWEKGEWRITDTKIVKSNSPVKAQIIADQYARDHDRNARFYD
ncbi:hypothetical protein BDW74DRAFT_183826 [Aspergillus multicolor]|uniref:uncharacterized protein n=1 Tax=Aspergillus multicolor TaxID=41759 RepID=UPI003CCC9A4B